MTIRCKSLALSTRLLVALLFIMVFHANAQESRNSGESNMKELKNSKEERATFAGGCFWCMQPAFDGMKGVTSTAVGYSGGSEPNPTYEKVGGGKTGHREAIEIVFDPALISYKALVDEFWKNIDPTQVDGQFADRGFEYSTAIFYHTDEQRKIAEESKRVLETSGKFSKPIVTAILPVKDFYRAEEYHQEYYRKNSTHYKGYKEGSGRGPFIREHWNNEDK